ncbi:MAG: hypothetical protein QOC67_607, partial [Pseudonocardiales bacterium]|nr:hypothetical protein [Pseudonocardiales bacterium]
GMPAEYLRRLRAMMGDLPIVETTDPAGEASTEATAGQLTWSQMGALLSS